MAEFASKGMAGTALGLGIAGTVGLLNQMGCNNNGNGLLGGLFGGNRNCGEQYETKECALLREQLATEKSERYADNVGIETYKAAVQMSNKNDDKINANYKELAQAIAEIKVNEAVTQSEIKCLATNTNSRFDALKAETAAAIKLESEHRECGDKNLYAYVNGTFVPGKLIMPLSSICPPAQPASGTSSSGGVDVEVIINAIAEAISNGNSNGNGKK